MSTHPVLSVVIRCDHCHRDLVDDETDNPILWPTRADAVTWCSTWAGDQSWEFGPNPTAGPDCCPACVCARDGHRYRTDPPDHPLPFRWCERCGAFATAPPPARPARPTWKDSDHGWTA